jgi:hypothetical protein
VLEHSAIARLSFYSALRITGKDRATEIATTATLREAQAYAEVDALDPLHTLNTPAVRALWDEILAPYQAD